MTTPPSTGPREEIIDYIRRNRVSSTEVADALGKRGVIGGVRALNAGHFKTGLIYWVYTYGESNWPLHEQIQDAPEGSIVVVSEFECGGRALFGDIVAKYLLLYRQCEAIVVRGALRDVHRLLKENWPVWLESTNPVGCFNTRPDLHPTDDVVASHRSIYDGGIAVCDDTGVVVIPEADITPALLAEMQRIEAQEDIWYECIDRRKWSTFKTICERAYLSDE